MGLMAGCLAMFAKRRWLAALLLGALAVNPARAETLRVAVASNFRPAMLQLAERFEQDSGQQLTLIFGSTGKHYAQIVNGAPFDAFLAADAERPRRLEQEGHALPGSRFVYALGRLVLWSPDTALVDDSGAILRSDRFRHLAIANPDLAPYGAAAREVLRALGVWEALQGRLVRGENIAQAYQFVASGNAELGFVARAQRVAAGADATGSSWTPPAALYGPIEQQAVLLTDSPATRAFAAFLQSAEARALIRAAGYDLP